MICKNCKHQLSNTYKFCNNCGALVVTNRISLGSLLSEMFKKIFGWDNKYFFTLKTLFLEPETVFNKYLTGTRKKFVNPFVFFAIGVTVALLVFNFFSEEYISLSTEFNEIQTTPGNTNLKLNSDPINLNNEKELLALKKEQQELNTQIQKKILKYFNFYSFILLPFYTFIGFLVYRKPHNYGEHLVINAYLQGVTLLFSVVFFILSLIINPYLYFVSMIFMVFYYSYAYSKLYEHTFKKTTIKFLKFIGVSFAVIIITLVLVLVADILTRIVT